MSMQKQNWCNLFSHANIISTLSKGLRILLKSRETFDSIPDMKKSLARRIIWLYATGKPIDSATPEMAAVRNRIKHQSNYRKETTMSHAGKKDKGQKEQKKKSKHTLKEKRKLKQEKNQQTEKKHVVIPG